MGFSGSGLNLGAQQGMFALSQSDQQTEVDRTVSEIGAQAKEIRENAAIQAMGRAREIRKVRERQALDFSSSGVEATQGTPAEVLNETVSLGRQELDFALRAEQSRADQFDRQALDVRQSARSAFLSNIVNFNNSVAQSKVQSIQSQGNPFISFFSALGSKLTGSPASGGSSLFKGVQGSKSFFSDLFGPRIPPPSTINGPIHGPIGGL